MSSVKTVRVGVMPGRIQEVAVEVGSSIAQVIEIAGLTASGYEVKVDGTKVTDLEGTKVDSSTNLVLLAKQVKGNAGTVRVGVMPGRIQEIAVEDATTIEQALEIAGLSASGYEVKVDGTKQTDLSQPVGSANLILLAKQVKGNAETTVRIGVMPGRIQEFVFDSSTSFADAIASAELSTQGYEVKADGNKVTDLSQPINNTNLILLAKQVKGN